MAMKYVGNGSFLPHVPARDLTDEEVEMYGGEEALALSRLYETVPKSRAKHEKPDYANKMVQPGSEDKESEE